MQKDFPHTDIALDLLSTSDNEEHSSGFTTYRKVETSACSEAGTVLYLRLVGWDNESVTHSRITHNT